MLNPTYDVTKSTKWNRENGPLFEGDIPVRESFPTKTKIWDYELNSPFGVPAGPLFNSKFTKLYAELGFDVITYKTVRSVERIAHPNPNIVYVNPQEVVPGSEIQTTEPPENLENLTITNSFGINSLPPKEWQEDFGKAKSYMNDGQLLVLSITGTPEAPRELVEDYVYTAALAKDAGAEVIEMNFSCPNVKSGGEGAIYLDPATSSEISEKVKNEVGNDVKVVIKLGFYEHKELLKEIVEANAPYVDGIAAINTIKMAVRKPNGEQALPGDGRLHSGLCGAGIKKFSLETVRDLAEIRNHMGYDFVIFGVGGITSPQDIDEMLVTGADIAQSGTAAMWDPLLAYKYYQLHAK